VDGVPCWSHIPWIQSPEWDRDRSDYLTSFHLILARTHANQATPGRTILHDVIAMGHHDGASGWITEDEALAFAVALLDAGARTGARDDLLLSTPLGWACRWGRTKIVRELLDRGVDPWSRTRSRGPRRERGLRRCGMSKSSRCCCQSLGRDERTRDRGLVLSSPSRPSCHPAHPALPAHPAHPGPGMSRHILSRQWVC
jgi:hypothetical protein